MASSFHSEKGQTRPPHFPLAGTFEGAGVFLVCGAKGTGSFSGVRLDHKAVGGPTVVAVRACHTGDPWQNAENGRQRRPLARRVSPMRSAFRCLEK